MENIFKTRKKNISIFSVPLTIQNIPILAEDVGQLVGYLPSTHEVLGSIFSTVRSLVTQACGPTQHLGVQGKAELRKTLSQKRK